MNSLIVGGLKTGMEVAVACPEGYRPPQEILEFAVGYGEKFTLTDDPKTAAKDADVVITDVWTSMGQEEERKAREAAFQGYCVDEALMAVPSRRHGAALPARPTGGRRSAPTCLRANAQYIFEEAENRLHAQKAVLVKTMGAAQEQ